MLDSFGSPVNVAILGASGGIGSALTQQLAVEPRVSFVSAFSRRPVDYPDPRVSNYPVDLLHEETIRAAVAKATAHGPLDLVIVTAGVLHESTSIQPEKTMRQLTAEAMGAVLASNTIGPALAAKHFLPAMRKDGKSVFAALSARVGSISDNRLGGWISYRASKSALNMVLKTVSIEHARSHPYSIVAALHPGTVDTPLARPFSKRVPAGSLFTPAESAAHLLTVIDKLTPQDSGGVFAWDGSRIDY
jgi:NAD(P)-dependent dehydrogenase (short-subunit alcohol dehydrogenase family)